MSMHRSIFKEIGGAFIAAYGGDVNVAQSWPIRRHTSGLKPVWWHTCYVSIVLLQLVGLNPLVAAFLVDMNFMVIGADGNF